MAHLPTIRYALLAILLASACADSGSKPSEAGAPIIDSLPLLQLTEELRIGSVDDTALGFSRIGRVALANDGTVYVTETRDREIRVFNGSGRMLRKIGKAGDGPGEFRAVGEIGILGDTLWVADGSARRITFFRTDGGLIGTVRAPRITVTPAPEIELILSGLRVRPDRRLDGISSGLNTGLMAPTQPMTIPRVAFDTTGTQIDTLGHRPYVINPLYFNPVKIGAVPVTLPDVPQLPDFVESSGAYYGLSQRAGESQSLRELRIVRTTFAGDTVYARTFRYHAHPYPPGFVDSIAKEFAQTYRSSQPVEPQLLITAVKDHTTLTDFQPPVTSVTAMNDEWLWMKTNKGADSLDVWLVLDANGAPRGRVQLSLRATVRWTSQDSFWAVVTDSLDVPWLVKYRFAREAP